MIKKLLFYSFLFAVQMYAYDLSAQVTVTATLGTPLDNYTTLGGAFAKINDGTHRGVITVTLTSSTTETATARLDSSGNTTMSSYTSISIKPQAGAAIVVSGLVAGPLVEFNGADDVAIDGINAGGASLQFNNSDIGLTATTLRLFNDASRNKFLNTTFKGSSSAVINAATGLGVITIASGLATGNDDNKFLNCDIDGSGLVASCIFAAGTTTSSITQNSRDTIQNCNIFDYFSPTIASPIGVYLFQGSTNWYIGGNSFFQTTGRSTALQGIATSLTIFPTWTSDTHEIIGNYVGGNSPLAGGSQTYTGTGTNVVGFIGINIQTGGPGNIIQNNIIRNVSVTYNASAGSFGNTGISGFIGGYDGVTTFSGNTVSNITITNTNGAALGSGMVMNGRVTTAATTAKPLFNVLNNTISNLTFNAGGTGSAQYYGIRLETSSANTLTTSTTISNPRFNVIDNTITNLNVTIGGASGWIRGIGSVNTNGTSSTCPLIPKAVIQSNIISAISCSSSLASIATNTAVGIQYGGTSNLTVSNVVDTTIIKGNTIYNINATNTADIASSVAGIIGTNGLYGITENKIYDLFNSSPGTASQPAVVGINVRASQSNAMGAASFIANNFVSIGTGTTNNTSHFGILNNFNATSAGINCYFNSVFIGGTASAGANNSAAMYRGPETFIAPVTPITTLMDIKNNILINQRSGGSGIHFAIGSHAAGSWTSNYNNLLTANASNIAYWSAAANTFAAFQTNSSGEANSKSVAVNFLNAAIGDLHLTGASNGDNNLRCNPLAGYTSDFDNQTRNTINPYMGADEASTPLPIQLVSFSGNLRGNGAVLSWTTTSEINADRFEIERSNIGNSNWSVVASTLAKGGAGKNEYSIINNGLTVGKWYYRLKMIDKDGSFKYSQIISLEITKGNQFVLNQNYPNPVKGQTRISYSLPTNGFVTIEVLNVEGKRIATIVNAQQTAGSYNTGFSSATVNHTAGTYFYRMVVRSNNNDILFTQTKQMAIVE